VNANAASLWRRAAEAIGAARLAADNGYSDTAASRAYYAAFYAVSALFALEGKEFRRQSAVEAALHRDLVHRGRWSGELGADYRALRRLRDTGDYGITLHVDAEQAREAITAADRIVEAVRVAAPHLAEET